MFVLLHKLTGLPILRRPTSFPAPFASAFLPRERSEWAANDLGRPSENQAKFTLTSVEIHSAVEMPQSLCSHVSADQVRVFDNVLLSFFMTFLK